MRLELDHEESIRAPLEAVRAYLLDVPASMAGVPGVERCERLGASRYRIVHAELSLAGYRLAAAYTVDYASELPDRIEFRSVEGAGDRLAMQGRIELFEDAAGTRVRVRQALDVGLPVPRLLARTLRGVAEAAATRNLAAFFDVARTRLEPPGGARSTPGAD